LVYEETGSGEPAMVFVHGWTCDRSHFAPQVAHFSPGHRCISIDLRGHGQSDKPEQAYTIDGFADDVAWICDLLGVREATLVGHSMGGAIVLAVAAARPALASAVVMCDPAILFPPEIKALAAQLAGAFAATGGMATMRQFGEGQFFNASSDAALKERVLAGMMKTPQHVVASAFAAITTFDDEGALAALKAPVLYIGAEPAISDLARLRELRPDAIIAKTAGSGHFHQLEVPEQVNAMISRFLAVAALEQASQATAATTA
jgi:pimeloyl-ACP methyl ester carboxylesterase